MIEINGFDNGDFVPVADVGAVTAEILKNMGYAPHFVDTFGAIGNEIYGRIFTAALRETGNLTGAIDSAQLRGAMATIRLNSTFDPISVMPPMMGIRPKEATK